VNVRVRLLLLCLALLVPTVASAQQAETIEYYGTDAIGSIRIVWDANGNVLGRQDYAPFGKALFPVPAMPKEGFVGNEQDAETDQGNFHARMSEARTGRFTRPDPIQAGMAEPQRWNRYAYALNSPFSYADPDGLQAECPYDACVTAPFQYIEMSDILAFFMGWSDGGGGASSSQDDGGQGRGRGTGQSTGTSTGTTTSTTTTTQPPADVPPVVPPPVTPPRVPPQSPPPTGFPSCKDLRMVGDVGDITIQSGVPGQVQWGVTMDKRIIGTVFVFEQFTSANGQRTSNTSRPYFYRGTAGTTHGSRQNLKSGSIYQLQALALDPPSWAAGAAGCIVP
jgi:RHS repeat-associated protein